MTELKKQLCEFLNTIPNLPKYTITPVVTEVTAEGESIYYWTSKTFGKTKLAGFGYRIEFERKVTLNSFFFELAEDDLDYIPLTGTESGKPLKGDITHTGSVKIGHLYHSGSFVRSDALLRYQSAPSSSNDRNIPDISVLKQFINEYSLKHQRFTLSENPERDLEALISPNLPLGFSVVGAFLPDGTFFEYDNVNMIVDLGNIKFLENTHASLTDGSNVIMLYYPKVI